VLSSLPDLIMEDAPNRGGFRGGMRGRGGPGRGGPLRGRGGFGDGMRGRYVVFQINFIPS
jgi:hypothetical protein